MLPKDNRLWKEKDFESVFKSNNGIRQGALFLRQETNDSDIIRFGFIVSKKFSKSAVERNRIKRILREVIKLRISKLKKGLDIIITVNPGAEPDFSKINDDINLLFKKAKIINENNSS